MADRQPRYVNGRIVCEMESIQSTGESSRSTENGNSGRSALNGGPRSYAISDTSSESGDDNGGNGNQEAITDLRNELHRALDSDKHDPVIEMDKHAAFRISNEFPPLRDLEADTVVYLGVPARVPGQDKEDYEHVCSHFSAIHLVSSAVLKDLNSTKIDNLFKPNPCIRAEKKFKKLPAYNRLSPEDKASIKYHIMLQPPEDGDDAALLMMALSCARGLRTWHLAKSTFGLSPDNVDGVDELDTPQNPYFITLAMALQGPAKIKLPVPTDYCPIRQRSGLERLLNVSHGFDPRLDSACKMWTYFATAQHFGCASTSHVKWWILNWFNGPGNSQFVQNNPELSYRIGMSCETGDFIKDAYAILVGEKALADVVNQFRGQLALPTQSIHGRPYEILDDDEQSRIGHAASSLIARIQSLFNELAVKDDWMMKSTEFRKLLDCGRSSPQLVQLVDFAVLAISNMVRRRIIEYLTFPLQQVHEELYACPDNTVLPHASHAVSFKDTYNGLPARARIFTRTFWLGLCQVDFWTDLVADSHFNTQRTWGNLSEEEKQDPLLRHILQSSENKNELLRKVQMVNDVILNNLPPAPRPSVPSTQPGRQPSYASRVQPMTSNVSSVRPSQPWSTTQPEGSVFPIEVDSSDVWPLLKRSQEDSTNETPATAGKRRKTIDANDTPISLPYRNNKATQDENAAKDAWNNPENFKAGAYDAPSTFTVPGTLNVTNPDPQPTTTSTSPARDPISEHLDQNQPSSITDHSGAWSTAGVYSAPLAVSPPSPTDPTTAVPSWKKSLPKNYAHKFINLSTMLNEFDNIIRAQAQEIVYPPHLFHGRNSVPVNLVDFVIALNDEEWKFLPLWVDGGCDDGTGGVFDTAVPNLEGEGGFRGGKRGMHVHHNKSTAADAGYAGTEADASVANDSDASSFTDVSSRDALSSAARASHAATDGTRTVVSMSDGASDGGFMNQDDVYEVIREMKAEQAVKAHEDAMNAADHENDDGGDVSTIMGAGSVDGDQEDVQGDFFGDDGDEDTEAGFEDDADFLPSTNRGGSDDKGKGRDADAPRIISKEIKKEEDEDEDMEIIDKASL